MSGRVSCLLRCLWFFFVVTAVSSTGRPRTDAVRNAFDGGRHQANTVDAGNIDSDGSSHWRSATSGTSCVETDVWQLDWSLENANGSVHVRNVSMPGQVQTALLTAGLLQDPYYRLNDVLTQWVASDNWTLTTSFELPAAHNALAVYQVGTRFPHSKAGVQHENRVSWQLKCDSETLGSQLWKALGSLLCLPGSVGSTLSQNRHYCLFLEALGPRKCQQAS
eukprot:m.302433 g.302433  ORF g.302433 m.302433 type:complete len:221 (+) comp19578_c0_seq7:75-737(+)